LVVQDGRIVDVLRAPADEHLPTEVYTAPVIAPGFIDLQVNGAFGFSVGTDGAAWRGLCARLPETGVTSFLPTLVSSEAALYPAVIETFLAQRDSVGAQPLGLHLEGPFLSVQRAGVHAIEALTGAPRDLYEHLPPGAVRLVTLAPERPGGLARVQALHARGIVVSLGHTEATFDETLHAVDAGASLVTHLYSAMAPFHHRAPGVVGAALVDDRLTVGLIADGVHCHPASVRLALRCKGLERVALVTDAMAGAGMPDGAYTLAGQDVTVRGLEARRADGVLAGSVLRLDQAVRNARAWGALDGADACRLASEVPARLLGLDDRGRLVRGSTADIVLLDDALNVQATLRAGACLHVSDS
jgi:N-acetylglucosamine-6-phosphate deacetylase